MHACSKNSVYGRARLQTNWRADDSSPKASENGRVPQGRHKGLHTIRRRLGAPDRDQCNANVSGSGSGPLVQGLIATRSARRIPCSRSEEHTSELQSRSDLVCRLLLEKKKKQKNKHLHCTAR